MKSEYKHRLWKYATVIVVALIIFNPEMVSLALFIDAVGLEIYLMLLEVQIYTILAVFLNAKIKPILDCMKNICARHFPTFLWRKIKEEPECLMYLVPSQATFMYLLVFSSAINTMFFPYFVQI